MEDLLREDDFNITPEFDYKKKFRNYYFMAFLIPVLINMSGALVADSELFLHFAVAIGILVFLLPITLSVVMILHSSGSRKLPVKVVIMAVLKLMAVYGAALLIVGVAGYLLNGDAFMMGQRIALAIANPIICFIISLIIILPIRYRMNLDK